MLNEIDLDPTDYWNDGYSVIFPNHRSRDMWILKYFKKNNVRVLSESQALTLSELLNICIQNIIDTQKQYLQENQYLVFHAHLLEKYQSKFQVNLKASEVIKAFHLFDHWLLTKEELEYFALFPQEKEFYNYFLYAQKSLSKISTASTLLRQLVEEQINPTLEIEKCILWAVDDLTPLQEKTLNLLKENLIVEICSLKAKTTPNSLEKFCFKNSQEELTFALNWLKNQNKNECCAIVIPQLSQQFNEIWQQSQEILDPQLAQLPLRGAPKDYALSHGFRGDKVPLVEQTLLLLQNQGRESPYYQIEQLPSLDLEVKRSFASWVEFIFLILQKIQWCEDLKLTSSEYQAREFFLDTLESIQTYRGENLFNLKSFLCILRQLFEQLLFQPQSPQQPKKLILGLLEATALPLDKIFLIQTSEQELLADRKPQSYYNLHLAQQKNFPQSSWEREIHYLTKMISRLTDRRPTLISFSQLNELNHQLQSPCLLIQELFGTNPYKQKQREEQIFEPLEYLYIDDNFSFKSNILSVSQINAFYHCPFKGYSQFLALPQIEEKISLPLSPREQGIYFHEYLQARLNEQDHNLLKEKYLSHLPEPLQQAEERKAYRVWLTVDKKLPKKSFSVEWPWKFQYEGFTIRGRCDLYQPQDKIIYDFKSKNFNFSGWFHHQPTDLQGPLYVHALEAKELGVIKSDPMGSRWRLENVEPYLESWKTLFQTLIKDIIQGKTSPQPRTSSHCRNCSLKQSCRYHLQ